MAGERNLPDDILADYVVECDEHLALIRQALIGLDAAGPHRDAGRLLEDLFRSYHSIKGLSAMVEFGDAEALAHALEGALRTLRDARGDACDLVPLLHEGTRVLESLIAAHHHGEPSPSAEAVMGRLLSAAAPASAQAPAQLPSADASRQPGEGSARWRVRFVPSAALMQRGIKVDVIRARLGEAGRIMSALPQVTAGGGVAFEFLITDVAAESAFDPAWRDDGMTWERVAAEGAGTLPAADAATGTETVEPSRHGVLAPAHVVRVDLHRLDAVMQRVADLVTTRARIDDVLQRVERHVPVGEWRALREHSQSLERHLRHLREDVMRVRLVRIDEIFRKMPFIVRDLARDSAKEVALEMSGQQTEVDKFLVDRLMDPLLHLVRNAVSHGIEAPEVRRANGKPARGTIWLSAVAAGDVVVLEVRDDGSGVDADLVRSRAEAMGVDPSRSPLDDDGLLELITRPGLSTRDEADRASGRGVGMSAVSTAVHDLGGRLRLRNVRGHGACFTLEVPVTLAITGALIASVGTETVAVPQNAVREVIEIDPATVQRMEGNELVLHRGRALPVLRLHSLLGLTLTERSRLHAFVVGTGDEAVALLADRVIGHREVVVRTLTDPVLKTDGISGATELGDGRLVLILDLPALSRKVRGRARVLEPPLSAAPARTAASSGVSS